ncbi:unnamed protein product [Cylindrotheca closterium]|uniref:Sulfatase N-terminal domain-containing protein n=1 Tax=Cylindrotheca closterium TaxID=2856 RepID=A0AAD2CSK7_9STRA|nr:unnamed protein product [Cylindrotheca closterium]
MASCVAPSLKQRHVIIILIFTITIHNVIASTSENPKKLPNFVVVLTDDLDLTLGGADASTLKKTRNLIADQGITLTNWFAQTPVCCPSRAELLTGRMLHNIRKPSMDAIGCMSVDVQEDLNIPFYQEYYFARHFSEDLNYTVGIFGKHLNTKNPKGCPRGVDRWLINGGGDYLNPSFYWASKGVEPTTVHFDNCTDTTGMPCYSTSVIGNATIDWIREHYHKTRRRRGGDDNDDNDCTQQQQQQHEQQQQEQPFFALVSVKAPHLQDGDGFPKAIPAPWYENCTIPETIAPRTPNYNHSCPDHHWLVRNQPPLTQLQGKEVDELYQSRLKTLLSVDDLVEGLVQTLQDLDLLENTYLLFTSDNGFRLGQFRMPEAKFHPYENDIRLPMMMRGPNLPSATRTGTTTTTTSQKNSILGTHVDLMPTLLGLATQTWNNSIVPPTMDGSNLAGALVVDHSTSIRSNNNNNKTNNASFGVEESSPSMQANPSSAILVEYPSLGNVVRYQHLMDTYNHTFLALRIIVDNDDDDDDDRRWNIKYIEFFDCREDWNLTGPALEAEYYDLDQDPFEMQNLIPTISLPFRRRLHEAMMMLYKCKGDSCRRALGRGALEHVMNDNNNNNNDKVSTSQS